MGIYVVMDKKEEYFEMLDKLYEGHSTQEENQALDALSTKQGAQIFDAYSRSHWEVEHAPMSNDQRQRMHNDIMSRVSALEDFKRHDQRRTLRTLWSVAAAVCLFAVAAFVGYKVAQHNVEEQTFVVVAERGEQSSIVLPDGSRVRLNSESQISYTSSFNSKERTIQLSGEAYFDVARNEDIPFIVKTSEVDITALGTKFNVRAYEDESSIVATLVEGKIVTASEGNTLTLSPNNNSTFDRNSRTLRVSPVENAEHAVPWLRDEVVFRGETLAQVALLLERMYDVEIEFKDEQITSYKYHGLVRNNELHNILSLIVESSPVTYRQQGNNIIFSKHN